jgi:hypothetical protein
MDAETVELRRQVRAGHRVIVERLLDQRTAAALAACPNERLVQNVLRLAIAELRSLRDPDLRGLARGEGGSA